MIKIEDVNNERVKWTKTFSYLTNRLRAFKELYFEVISKDEECISLHLLIISPYPL